MKTTSAPVLAALLSLMSALSQAAPTINTSPSSVTPTLGSTTTLAASVTAEPGASYVWVRDGTAIINGGRYSGATTATLSISGANASDNGSYTLTVTDGSGSSATTPASITVTQSAASLDPAYNGAGANGSNSAIYTNTVLHLPDGRTLLAVKNQFNGVTGTATSNLVVMSATGAVSHPGLTTPGTGGSFVGGSNGGDVRSIFRMGDGKILVAGDFTTHRTDSVVNTARNRVARLNADLTLDTSFVATGPSTVPQVVFADSYGRIYLGGAFISYDGLTGYNYLVRLKDDGTLDQNFKPALNGAITDAVLQKDGRFIIIGSFTEHRASGAAVTTGRIMRFDASGMPDPTFTGSLIRLNHPPTAIAMSEDDHFYVTEPSVVQRYLPNGARDPAFDYTNIYLATPTAIETMRANRVLVGGDFASPSNRLAAIGPDGAVDASFSVGTGLNSVSGTAFIQSIKKDGLGRMWVLGSNFSTYNGSVANRFAVIQGSGGPTLAFAAQPTGSIVNQGGSVTLTAHATGNNGFTYQWQKNGSPLSNGGNVSGATTDTLTLTNIQEADQAAYTVVVSSPGATSITSRVANLDVLGAPEITQDPVASASAELGGSVTLTAAAAGATTLIYQWYKGSTALTNGANILGATTPSLTLSNLTLADAGDYFLRVTNGLGSDDSNASTLTVNKFSHGVAPGTWPTFNNEVRDILLLPDGSFVVGGAFSTVTINGTPTNRNRLARILANGNLDTSFPTADSTVVCLARDKLGNIFIGGDFDNILVGSTPSSRKKVAKLTSAFAVDAVFNTSAGPNDTVLTLAPVGDGSVYVGGEFTVIGTNSADSIKYMVRLKANGTVDTSFKSAASNYVKTILRLSSGTLYAGGASNSWGTALLPGVPAGRLVKLNASGGRDTAFASPDIFTIPNEVIELDDKSLFVVGNGLGQPYLRRVSASKGANLGLSTAGHLSQVNCAAQLADGRLLSGALGTLLLTNLSGAVDSSFNVGGSFNSGLIHDIEIDSAGRIYVAGNFTYANGTVSRSKFVVLNGVDPRDQVLNLPAPANPTFLAGQNTFTLAPTSSSGLPVTLTLNSGPATLSGKTLTILGAGVISITATQPGGTVSGRTYNAATPVTTEIIVPKSAQTISFAPLIDRPTGTRPFLLSATSSSGLPVSYEVMGGPASVSGNLLTLTGATGEVSIRASHPGDDNYEAAADVEQSFEVFEGTPAKLTQSILFNPLPNRSLSQDLTFSLGATASSGLPLSYTFTGPVTSIVDGLVTLSGATGNVTITAKQSGNASFLPAADVKQSFTVTAAVNSLTLVDLIQTYTGTARRVSVIGGTADVIYYTVNKVKVTTAPTVAGSYPVEAVSGTGTNAIKKTGLLVINKAPLLVVADDKRKFIGQANPLLTFAYSGFLGSDNAGNSISKAPAVTTKAKASSVGGVYPITPSGGVSANYKFVYINGSLKIESWAGQYETIITDPITHIPSAKIEFTVAASSRSLTGKLTTSKQTSVVSFKGSLGLDFDSEYAMADINATVGKGSSAIVYNLKIDIPLNADFSATVTRQEGPAAATTLGVIASGKKLQLYSGKPPVTFAGAHTMVFAPDTSVATLAKPTGSGFATASIDAKGKMSLVAFLADGTKVTASLMPDSEAHYRLYALPYKGRSNSYCAAWFEPQEHPDLPGRGLIIREDNLSLYWAKTAKGTDTNYRGGIPESACGITMDPWLPPATKPAIITLAQRLLLNGTGDMEPLFEQSISSLTPGIPTLLRMGNNAAVTVNQPVTTPANQSGYKISIISGTGAFSGSFNLTDGATKRLVKFSGVMRLPPSNDAAQIIGAGFAIVPQLTGQSGGTISTKVEFQRPGSLE